MKLHVFVRDSQETLDMVGDPPSECASHGLTQQEIRWLDLQANLFNSYGLYSCMAQLNLFALQTTPVRGGNHNVFTATVVWYDVSTCFTAFHHD